MGRLTTHVLDTVTGAPGCDIEIQLHRVTPEPVLLKTVVTNDDGRCDRPLLEGAELSAGVYELVFAAGAYFAGKGITQSAPAFLDQVVIRFGVNAPDQHYHVPLLLATYGYSTYRGS